MTGRHSAPEVLTISEAIALTTLPKNTLHRRLDAYAAGRRDAYAIKGFRPHPTAGRRVDYIDAVRVTLQEAGRLDGKITSAQWEIMYAEWVEQNRRTPA